MFISRAKITILLGSSCSPIAKIHFDKSTNNATDSVPNFQNHKALGNTCHPVCVLSLFDIHNKGKTTMGTLQNNTSQTLLFITSFCNLS